MTCSVQSLQLALAVSLWMADGLMLVQRAGACSHELFALQIEVEVQSSLEWRGLPVLGCLSGSSIGWPSTLPPRMALQDNHTGCRLPSLRPYLAKFVS